MISVLSADDEPGLAQFAAIVNIENFCFLSGINELMNGSPALSARLAERKLQQDSFWEVRTG